MHRTRDEPMDDGNSYTMFRSGDDSVAGAGEYPDEHRPYTTFNNGDRPAGGMYDMTGVTPDGVPPHWIVHFAVADVDATIGDAERLGGRTLDGPMPIPGVGTMAFIADPQGAAFAILQPERD